MKDRRGRGRKTRLSKEKLEDIKNTILTTTPEDFGYNTSTWNGLILRDYIKKVYKVEYKHAQIYNILQKLGFSYQKGKLKYPAADEAKREKFNSQLITTFLRIKTISFKLAQIILNNSTYPIFND